jgi:hypothetical protein
MANTLNGKELLPEQASLTLCNVVKGDNQSWMVNAAASLEAANCPDCGGLSTARHSSYLRHLSDLPVQGRAVKLTVRVGRWGGRNSACERRIFCQRLNEVAYKHARETKRFCEVEQLIAYALGGRPGQRLSRRLGFPIGKHTLLQRIKQMAQSRPIPVVGVDEWAWRSWIAATWTFSSRSISNVAPRLSWLTTSNRCSARPSAVMLASNTRPIRRCAPARSPSGMSA